MNSTLEEDTVRITENVATRTIQLANAPELLQNIFASVMTTRGTINITMVCEELTLPMALATSYLIKDRLRNRRHIDLRILSQSILQAGDAIIHSVKTTCRTGNGPLEVELGRAPTDKQILAGLHDRCSANRDTQETVKGWKRLFRNAGRPESARFAYRAHGSKPDNDSILIETEDPDKQEVLTHLLLIPRQPSLDAALWSGLHFDDLTGFSFNVKQGMELLWSTGCAAPTEVKNYPAYFSVLVQEWRRMTNIIDGRVREGAMTGEGLDMAVPEVGSRLRIEDLPDDQRHLLHCLNH